MPKHTQRYFPYQEGIRLQLHGLHLFSHPARHGSHVQVSLTTLVVNSVGIKEHLPDHVVLRVNHLGQTLTSYSAAT